tara:strand:- start:5224 stop:6276 length:1053 start_codon:yes stop_codon:yes gene_type:complete
MKILIIQNKMIGDVLTSSILFEALKQKYPTSVLHFVINPATLPVLENNPFIDEFIYLNNDTVQSVAKFYKFLISIKKENYDTVIDVYGKLNSALISLFSKAPIKSAYYKKYTSFIYSHTFNRLTKPENKASLAIENRIKLLEPLNVAFSPIFPKIYLTDKEIDASKQFLEKNEVDLQKPLYMISVLGSNKQKTYPLNYIVELIDEIAKQSNSQLLFNYIPVQKADAKYVFDQCQVSTQKKIFFNVYGKSLREFLAITKHCTALIGNEGGANNMAKALDIPTFTLFSPYLNKHNWFGNKESKKHIAVHLADFIELSDKDLLRAKKDPKTYYLKLKPFFIKPLLNSFLSTFE